MASAARTRPLTPGGPPAPSRQHDLKLQPSALSLPSPSPATPKPPILTFQRPGNLPFNQQHEDAFRVDHPQVLH